MIDKLLGDNPERRQKKPAFPDNTRPTYAGESFERRGESA